MARLEVEGVAGSGLAGVFGVVAGEGRGVVVGVLKKVVMFG